MNNDENMLIYISGPYSKGDKLENVKSAIRLADAIASHNANVIPYVPHFTHYWDELYPHPYEFWMNLDLMMLDKCDALVRMPGDSSGADIEVEFAEQVGIPVIDISELLPDIE